MSQHRQHARCGCALSSSAEQHTAGIELAAGVSGRPFPFASTTRVYERDRPFIVRHLALDIALDVEAKTVEGTAALDITRVDPYAAEIVLDAVGFEISRVEVDGVAASHVYDGRELRVAIAPAAKTARVSVAYKATPRRGIYFLAPDDHVRDRPHQVWTQCQEEDGRYWFPCHDKPHIKMTTEIAVRVPRGWYALSNGELASKRTSDDPNEPQWAYHWKMNEPHASYLVTLVAGEFSILEDSADGVPLTYLVPKGREADGRRSFARTPDMIRHFGALTGVPYPWGSYAQVVVHDFIFGGMENTTATTMYEHVLLDERAALDVTSDDLIAHELAHQWFGDYVTCRDWSEGWLNEGFATYLEHVWREQQLGKDEYEYGIKTDLDAYVGEAHGRYRRPIVCQDYDAPLDLFDRHLYEKGGLVLHMLRVELGTELFWKGVGIYLQRHGRSVVETRDLERALEEVSGKSLGRFFEQWVQKPGHPEIEVALSWEKERLVVSVKQQQAATDGVPAQFELPLVLDIDDGSGSLRRERIVITQRLETFALRCTERPQLVIVDPEMRILGDVKVKAPLDMLRAQLEEAPTARGRWLAALALASADDPVTIAALASRLADGTEFWGVRAECAEALGKIRAQECFDALRRSVGVTHPKVRRAIVAALGAFRTAAAVDVLRPIALKDASYLVEAEAARSLGKTRREGAFDVLVDVLDRPSWADVIRGAAADGLAALRDERALPHLLARTRYGHPERARRAALMALPKLSSDRRTRESIEELLDDNNPHLRIDAVRALAEMGDPRARGAMRARLEVDLDPRVRRRIREVLRDLGGDAKSGVREVREELDKVASELSELKARMSKIEAREGAPPRGLPPAREEIRKVAAPAPRAPLASPKKRNAPATKARVTTKSTRVVKPAPTPKARGGG